MLPYVLLLALACATVEAVPSRHTPKATPTAITENDLKEFNQSSPEVQQLIREALSLSALKLKYLYGSADPAKGGVDCSGTMNYLLKKVGVDNVPRDSRSLYFWTQDNGLLHPVANSDPQSPDFDNLKPGDLLFWSGTQGVQRRPAISHVMLYIGRDAKTGKRLMMGASSSRTPTGVPVGVSNLYLPKPTKTGPRFVGYGSILGLGKVTEGES
jgi:peptidoglycan DL-endopeptidase CwlO